MGRGATPPPRVDSLHPGAPRQRDALPLLYRPRLDEAAGARHGTALPRAPSEQGADGGHQKQDAPCPIPNLFDASEQLSTISYEVEVQEVTSGYVPYESQRFEKRYSDLAARRHELGRARAGQCRVLGSQSRRSFRKIWKIFLFIFGKVSTFGDIFPSVPEFFFFSSKQKNEKKKEKKWLKIFPTNIFQEVLDPSLHSKTAPACRSLGWPHQHASSQPARRCGAGAEASRG